MELHKFKRLEDVPKMLGKLLIPCFGFALLLHHTETALLEMSGFHCKHASSMRLDRELHGEPHITTPPFEFSIVDDKGNAVEYYTPGEIYKVRLVGYIHFRGFMIQSRLCTPEGYTIGSLRGGRFILGNSADIFGVRYQRCDDSQSNDALTHTDSSKKFLVEVQWTTERDVGAVQFMLTVAAEDELYWERWRPRNGFIRPRAEKEGKVVETLFEIEVSPGPDVEPTMSPEEEATALSVEDGSTAEPFDAKLFEEIEAAEESESNRLKSAESLIALHSAFMPHDEDSSESSTSIPTLTSPSTLATTSPTSTASATTEPTTMDSLTTSSISPTTPSMSTTSEIPLPTTIEDITTISMNETIDFNSTSRRLFKKYTPSKEVELRDDDLRFLNSHVQLLQHDIVDEEMDPEETCRQANPCENGGKCLVKDRQRWTCALTTLVLRIPRAGMGPAARTYVTARRTPWGRIASKPTHNLIRIIRADTVTTICFLLSVTCPEDLCSGNGECIMRSDGKIGCRCNSEINECLQNKCRNAVECIDKFDDYECVCEKESFNLSHFQALARMFTDRVERGSEKIPRESTDFFHLNCPVSCEKCVPMNDTNTAEPVDRLPAVLLPLSWMLGIWETEVKGFNGRALDFPLDFNSTAGYNETIVFSVAKPIMFGTPSINFTCTAVNNDDPTDIHTQQGFLTIRQYPPAGEKVMKVALTTVNNQGSTMIEEGPMTKVEGTSGPILNLSPIYMNIQKDLQRIMPKKISRSFTKKGSRLIQTATKETNGRKIKFKKTQRENKTFMYKYEQFGKHTQ
ncbi:reeler domain protein [Ancylostoma ceylanicum]|uniref:Reeler domain protein n=1 Tax=Ancylostoma ceylanicum TaxID=53326 RepID=A0A0D6M259_9BILA|nr:reeler domain protein [Ancylostoma ceylanicum]